MSIALAPQTTGEAAHPKSTSCWHGQGFVAYGGGHSYGIVNGGVRMGNSGLPYFMPWVWDVVAIIAGIITAVIALVMICGQ